MAHPKLMAGLFGTIAPPYTGYSSDQGGLIVFFTNVIRLLVLVSGLYALINVVMAGFGFVNAGGDAKKIEAAWSKIWQSAMGMLIIVSVFAIMGVLGLLMFGNYNYFLQPVLYGVGTQ